MSRDFRASDRRSLGVAALVTASVLTLAGCGSSPTAASGATAGAGGPPTSAGVGPVAAEQEWAHVHNLTVDGGRLLLGTHDGLWEQFPGQLAQRLSESSFDVMGFALLNQRMLASGHPGEGEDLPADLGLQQSTDGGVTWTGVSLEGEVDFHRLRAVGNVVLGLSAHDGLLLRSTDGGRTWTNEATPPLFDLALDPADPSHVVGTTQQGPVVSDDGGSSFAPIKGAPLLAVLAWTPKALYGVTPDGVVYSSKDSSATWRAKGQVAGPPMALAADGDTVVVLAGAAIVESIDGGATFTPRITGLVGH